MSWAHEGLFPWIHARRFRYVDKLQPVHIVVAQLSLWSVLPQVMYNKSHQHTLILIKVINSKLQILNFDHTQLKYSSYLCIYNNNICI